MMLLKNVGLPKKFSDAESGYAVLVDENPNFIYETHLFKTNLDFSAAIDALDTFISKSFGASQKTLNELSCVIIWKSNSQKITAQISNLDGYIGGYINSQSAWIYSNA